MVGYKPSRETHLPTICNTLTAIDSDLHFDKFHPTSFQPGQLTPCVDKPAIHEF
jgi:hypothetical protein